MRNALLTFATICLITIAHAQDVFRSHITADRALLLKNIISPEHLKLLNYAIDRITRAQGTLSLAPDGTYLETLDDGDEHDKTTGTWRKEGTRIILSPNDDKEISVEVRGAKLFAPFLYSKTFTIEYSRG